MMIDVNHGTRFLRAADFSLGEVIDWARDIVVILDAAGRVVAVCRPLESADEPAPALEPVPEPEARASPTAFRTRKKGARLSAKERERLELLCAR